MVTNIMLRKLHRKHCDSCVRPLHCWYSEPSSFILYSASVDSLSSMPSPVYQLRKAFGLDAMNKLVKMAMLIVGERRLGVKTAKRLILAGLARVDIYDANTVEIKDLTSNFYLAESDAGKRTRAAAFLGQLQGLVPYVKVGTDLLYSLNDIHGGGDLAEDGVLSAEVSEGIEAEEELGSFGVGASVGDGEDTEAGVSGAESLAVERHAVDGLSASSVSSSEVAALGHKSGNDSVEGAALVVEGLAEVTDALLGSAEGAEVLSAIVDVLRLKVCFDHVGTNLLELNWDVDTVVYDHVFDGGRDCLEVVNGREHVLELLALDHYHHI